MTGVYRTGSTFLSRLLNTHPDISATYDSIHFMRFCYGEYNPLNKHNAKRLVYDLYKRVNKRFGIKFPKEKVLKNIFKKNKITYKSIYNELMKVMLLKDKPAKYWGEKTNVAWSKIPHFLKMFSKGKTILIIRDPRDILCSFKKMTNISWPNYLDAIFAWLDSFQKGQMYLKKLPKEKFYLVKYEDLVSNPRKFAKKLCKFLEIDFVPSMLNTDFYKDRTGRKWKSDTAFDKPLKNISKKAINRWKNVITSEELLLVESILGKEMIISGYKCSNKKFSDKQIKEAIKLITKTSLLRERFVNWLDNGCGVEAFPTDPLNPKNWDMKDNK